MVVLGETNIVRGGTRYKKFENHCSIDFRRNVINKVKTSMIGQEIEVVKEQKYLGSIIDDKLCFEQNTSLLFKKGQQRLYCLRKLAKFNVDKTLMTLLYRCFVESVVTFSIICWYGSITVKQNKLPFQVN